MRIGLVTGEYPPMQGGVGAYTAILADRLARAGHHVHVLTTRLSTGAERNTEAVTVESPIQQWNRQALGEIRAWAIERQLDVVNLQFQTAAYGMSPWIHFLPDVLGPTIPLVTTFHDLRVPYLFPKAGKMRSWIVQHLAARSSGVIVTNHEDDHQLQKLPCRALIPIGSNILDELDSLDTAYWRRQAGANPQDFLIAYFGLANQTKGIDTLIEAVRKLRSQSIPARLVMIGSVAGSSDPSNQAYSQHLNQIIIDSGVSPYIHRTGYIPDSEVGAYLTAADVVALPFRDGASFRRGSLIAPIHYGCAIVTTRPSVPIPEFIEGEHLLYCAPEDAGQLTDALRRLFESSALRERLQAGARALAPTFDWDRIARQTADFFAQVSA
jgi:glycosyltransferase involved in cell wall biosynthesis